MKLTLPKLLIFAAALALLPAIALAQAVTGDAAAPPATTGIGWPAIMAALTVLATVLGAILNFIPSGWRTYANIAAGVLATAITALAPLAASGEKVAIGAILAAFVGAFIGKRKAEAGK